MPSSIADIQALDGYEVGIAQGSVSIEEDALVLAREAADPTLIQEQANTVVADTITALTKLDRIPKDENERLQMFADMGELAFQTLTSARGERVALHERALAIAREMPNVWRIDGPLIHGIYIAAKEDGTGWDEAAQAQLDLVLSSHPERSWLAAHPEALSLMERALGSPGHIAITRPEPGADVFVAEGATMTLSDLEPYVTELEARPAQQSIGERVATVLSTAPELSDATRAGLLAALETHAS